MVAAARVAADQARPHAHSAGRRPAASGGAAALVQVRTAAVNALPQ